MFEKIIEKYQKQLVSFKELENDLITIESRDKLLSFLTREIKFFQDIDEDEKIYSFTYVKNLLYMANQKYSDFQHEGTNYSMIKKIIELALKEIEMYFDYFNAALKNNFFEKIIIEKNALKSVSVLINSQLGKILKELEILEIFMCFKYDEFFMKTSSDLSAFEKKIGFSLQDLIEKYFDSHFYLLQNKYFGQYIAPLIKFSIVLRKANKTLFEQDDALPELITEVMTEYILSLDNSKIKTFSDDINNNCEILRIPKNYTHEQLKQLLDEIKLSGYEEGHIDTIKQLLIEVDINAQHQDLGNVTPLHYAAAYGSKEVVQLLLDSGAKIDLKVEDQTADQWAENNERANNEHKEIARLIIYSKLFVNLKNFKQEYAPLLSAALISFASGKIKYHDKIKFAPLAAFIVERKELFSQFKSEELIKFLKISLDIQSDFGDVIVEELLLKCSQFQIKLNHKQILEIFVFFKFSETFAKNSDRLFLIEKNYKFNLLGLIKSSLMDNVSLLLRKYYGGVIALKDKFETILDASLSVIKNNHKISQELINELILESHALDMEHADPMIRNQYLGLLFRTLETLPLDNFQFVVVSGLIIEYSENDELNESIKLQVNQSIKSQTIDIFKKKNHQDLFSDIAILRNLFSYKKLLNFIELKELYPIIKNYTEDKENVNLLYQKVDGLEFQLKDLKLTNLCIAAYCSLYSPEYAILFLGLKTKQFDLPSIAQILNKHLTPKNDSFKEFIRKKRDLLKNLYEEATINTITPIKLSDEVILLFEELKIRTDTPEYRKRSKSFMDNIYDKFFKNEKEKDLNPQKRLRKLYLCILGLKDDGNLSKALIKEKYQERVKIYHPDKNSHLTDPTTIKGKKELTQQLNAAYAFLMDQNDIPQTSKNAISKEKMNNVELKKFYLKQLGLKDDYCLSEERINKKYEQLVKNLKSEDQKYKDITAARDWLCQQADILKKNNNSIPKLKKEDSQQSKALTDGKERSCQQAETPKENTKDNNSGEGNDSFLGSTRYHRSFSFM